MIRRKSDAEPKPVTVCAYGRQMAHEHDNQRLHEQRQQADPDHGRAWSCWCCCEDCADLEFVYFGMWPPAWTAGA